MRKQSHIGVYNTHVPWGSGGLLHISLGKKHVLFPPVPLPMGNVRGPPPLLCAMWAGGPRTSPVASVIESCYLAAKGRGARTTGPYIFSFRRGSSYPRISFGVLGQPMWLSMGNMLGPTGQTSKCNGRCSSWDAGGLPQYETRPNFLVLPEQ